MTRRLAGRILAGVIVMGAAAVLAFALFARGNPTVDVPADVLLDVSFDATLAADALDATVTDATTRSRDFIDFIDPDASDDVRLPGWPGWPLPKGQTVTPEVFCEGTFGVTLFVRNPKCSRAETLYDLETNKHGFEAFGQSMSRSQVVRCIARLGVSVAKARVDLDPEAGARCIAAHIRDAFGDFTDVIESAECNGYIVGRQREGERCGQPWECVDGLACVGFTSKADGVCKKLPSIGARCGNGLPEKNLPLDIGDRPACVKGARCPPWGGTCEPRIKSGRPCKEDWDCMEGLACHAKKCADKERVAAGGACLKIFACAQGLYCSGTDYMDKLGTCTEKKAAGEPCRDDTECRGRCRSDEREDAGRRRHDRTCISWCQSG